MAEFATQDGSYDRQRFAPALSFEALVNLVFVRGLRRYSWDYLYPEVVRAAAGTADPDPAEIEQRMSASPPYQLYSWIERFSQQQKYYSRWGLAGQMEPLQTSLRRTLDDASRRFPERLRLDPSLELPDYVRDVDTHQIAGGISDRDADGFLYEAATAGFSFSLLDSESTASVNVDAYRALLPANVAAPRLLDLGCTHGVVARSLKRAFPEADVHGCDVCAPPLRLAHLRSLEEGLAVTWWQAGAERLPFEDRSVDVVGSHWLFHEMPPRAIRACLREARRVLIDGGGFMAHDMYLLPGGAIGQWLQAGYAARNNEPFAFTYPRMNMRAELEAAGFRNVRIGYSYPEPSEAVVAGAPPDTRTMFLTMITAVAR